MQKFLIIFKDGERDLATALSKLLTLCNLTLDPSNTSISLNTAFLWFDFRKKFLTYQQ